MSYKFSLTIGVAGSSTDVLHLHTTLCLILHLHVVFVLSRAATPGTNSLLPICADCLNVYVSWTKCVHSSHRFALAALSWPQPDACSAVLTVAQCLQHYLDHDQKLKKFVPIIHNSIVYPVILDSNGTVASLPPVINGAHSAVCPFIPGKPATVSRACI